MSWITDECEGMVLSEQSFQILQHQQRIVHSSLTTSGDGRPVSTGDAAATSASSYFRLAQTAPTADAKAGNTRKAFEERPSDNNVHDLRENAKPGPYQLREPPGLYQAPALGWMSAPENQPRLSTAVSHGSGQPRYPFADDEKQAANFAQFIDLAGWDAGGPGGTQTTTELRFTQAPVTAAFPSFNAGPPSRFGPFFPTTPLPTNQQPPPPPPPFFPTYFAFTPPQLGNDAGAYDQYLANLAGMSLPYLSPAAITPKLSPTAGMAVSPHFSAIATTGAVFSPPQVQAPPPGISATVNVQLSGYFPPIRPPNPPAYPYSPPSSSPNPAMYPYIERGPNGDQIDYGRGYATPPPITPRPPPPPAAGLFWPPWSTPTMESVGHLRPDSFTWNPAEMGQSRQFGGEVSSSTSPAEATIRTTPSTDSQQTSPAFWPESVVATPVFASAENVTTDLLQMQTMSIGSGKPVDAAVAMVESSVESEWSATVTTAQTALNGASPSGENNVSSASSTVVGSEEVGSGAGVRSTRRTVGAAVRGGSKGRAGVMVKVAMEEDRKSHGKVHGREGVAAARVAVSEETMHGDEDEVEVPKFEEEDEYEMDSAAIKRRKNTLAARRSRARKQERQNELENIVRELEGRNSELVQHLATLESERRRWMEGQDAQQKRIRDLEGQLLAVQEWMNQQQLQRHQQNSSGSGGTMSGTTPRRGDETAERVMDWVFSSAVKTERESAGSRGSGNSGEEGGAGAGGGGFGSLVVPWVQNLGKGRGPDAGGDELGKLVRRSQP